MAKQCLRTSFVSMLRDSFLNLGIRNIEKYFLNLLKNYYILEVSKIKTENSNQIKII